MPKSIRQTNLKRKVERLIRSRHANEYKMDKLRELQSAHPDIDIVKLELDSEGTTPFLLACVIGNESLATELFDITAAPLHRDHYLHDCYARAVMAARANIPVDESIWDDEMVQKAVALVGKLTTSELKRIEEEAALFGGRRKTIKKRKNQKRTTRRS
jgi:hypothetical protein